MKVFANVLLTACVLLAVSAHAEDPVGESHFFDRALDLSFGKMLPYDVYGVRDIYSYWGLRFTKKIWGIYPEFSGTFINDKNVNFYTGSLSVMFPDQVAGFTLLTFLGVDAHYFSGHTVTKKLAFVQSGGFHLGAAPVIELSQSFGLRVDFKLNFGPGMSLLVGGGLTASF